MTNEISPNYLEALRLLRIFTNGNYDIWSLAGRGNAIKRVNVMSAIQGFKVPQAKAGVNAMRDSLYDASGASMINGTLRAQEQAFIAWAHENGDQTGG